MKEIQRPAPASAANLATLVDIAPMPLAFFNSAYEFVYANEAAAQQVGIPRDQLPGLTLEGVLPESWVGLKEIFERAFAGETIRNLDVDLSEISDKPREWLGSFYPVREHGEIIAVACTSTDVTELRDAERALKTRNDLFAMLARVNAVVSRSATKEELYDEICAMAISPGNFRYAWVGMPKNGVLSAVARAGNDGGYMASLDAAGLMITTDPDDPRSQGPTGQAYLRGEMSFVNNYFESPLTGLWRDAAREVGFESAAALPIREQGRVVAVLTLYSEHEDFFTDELIRTLAEIMPSVASALDRFELERRRNKNEAELILRDRALSAATEGVVITDAQAGDNPIIYVTPALEELTGYSSEDLVGQNCRVLQGEDTDPAAVAQVRNAIEEGRSCEVELLNYRKNGESFWNRLTISPIFDDAGTLTNFVGVQTDVTEQRLLELQVRQAQKMEAVGQLAGGVAHDFNNALTAIRSSVDLALSEVQSGSAREDLRQIDKAAEHAADLTRQLLAFSRQQVLKPQSTDLNQVVTETGKLVTRVIGDDIELIEDLTADLKSVLVDRAQLQQVIINLCINARDAMTDGGRITIETSSCNLDESYVANRFVPKAGRYALLEVADNGAGMDLETQDRVFEPFFTTKLEGTGLGLATVYGIVNQSGGHLSLESEPNIGTRFKIYLPTTSEAIAPDRSEPTPTSASVDGTETILHVEDSELLRPLVTRVLGRHGYTVLSAADAEEAIEIAKAQAGKIDLVITDVVMPGLNGRELADILQAQYPGLRVLFTSGYPADVVIREGIAEAEVNYIEKPFLAKDLLPLVRSILDGAKARTV